jgi:dienelactone hydrolase
VLGLRPAVLDFAKQLTAAGHSVTAPDLYNGETFDDYEEGNKKWSALGIPALLKKAEELSKELTGELVYAGFSNGAALAEFLAATQPNAKGAVLMHGALPLDMLQLKTWPKHVSVQLHYNEHDPFRDPNNDTALQKSVEASGTFFKEFLYPGKTHLFADAALPDYDAASAKLMTERVLLFLKGKN